MSKILKSVHLECRTGGCNKEYRLTLEQDGIIFQVNALWGKIGSSLTPTTKHEGTDQVKADKEYEKILKKQLNASPPYLVVAGKDDGQTAESALVAASNPVVRTVVARILPQLCEAIKEESELEPYFASDLYVMEEKLNGERRHIIKVGDKITVTNKKGQISAKGILPETADAFKRVKRDFVVDTEDEVVGGGCVLLDILSLDGKPLDRKSGDDRYEALEAFYDEGDFGGKVVRLTRRVSGSVNKRAFLKILREENAEGAIFKNRRAPYIGGDAGRAEWKKFKFQGHASFIVVKKNPQNSVQVAVLDGLRRVMVGDVTIPPNKAVPPNESVIEVRYLYAHRGGKIFQPFFLGPRHDVDPKECQMSQLKYKQEIG